MQIITDFKESKAFIKNMRQSFADMDYWQDWYILDITAPPALDWIKQAKISALVRANLPDVDGSVLWLDESLMIVFQHGEGFDPQPFRVVLEKELNLPSLNVQLLHVAREQEDVLDVIARLLKREVDAEKPAIANYQFLKSLVPNVDDLLHNWHEERPSRNDRKCPHIMIVDDDPMTLRLVSGVLEKEYEVILAHNGAEAIAKHLQLMPDIIFLDIGLPDCDGLTLLSYMQQYDQECRIVMFSADSFLKTRMKALANGAKGYLVKPFNQEGFQKHIAQWFSGKQEDDF